MITYKFITQDKSQDIEQSLKNLIDYIEGLEDER